MGDYGIKISKPGFSILTTGIENQIFNSTANSLKIWMTGSTNISADPSGSGTVTVDIAHSLGYAPFFLVFFKLKDANKLWMQDSYDNTRLPTNFSHGFAASDSTNLKVSVTTDEAAYTAVAYYIIFIDKAYE